MEKYIFIIMDDHKADNSKIEHKVLLNNVLPISTRTIELKKGISTKENILRLLSILEELPIRRNVKVVILNTKLFGPIYPINSVMEKWGTEDVFSLIKTNQFYKNQYISWINLDYIGIHWNEKMRHGLQNMINLFRDDIPSEIILSDYLYVNNYSICSYIDVDETCKTLTTLYRSELLRPYKFIKEYKYPFFHGACFDSYAAMELLPQKEILNAIQYIEKETAYDTNLIYHYLINNCDINDIKKILHLEYIIPSNARDQEREELNKKIAIFIHLYYDDLFDLASSYIKKIPSYIDLYLSTPLNKQSKLKKVLLSNGIQKYTIVNAGERGRDAGALLVGFQKYTLKYDYICFVHDKKSSGGLSKSEEGEAFMELTWDNLLSNVNEVLHLFEEDKKLGFLAPPLPLTGSYMKSVIGNEWTVCYEETEKLGKMLDIDIRIDEKKDPFALSTMFWCKTEALRPLLQYQWKYEDFPQEPLRLDGTINHAIERLLIYVVQSQGFYGGIVSTREYASVYLNNLMYILENILSELHQSNLVEIRFPIQINDLLKSMMDLQKFCESHKRLYVYGAGAQAKIMQKRLRVLDRAPEAYVVSNLKGNVTEIEGIEVIEFTNIDSYRITKEDAFIIAMSKKYQDEISSYMDHMGVDYYCIDAE